MNKQGSVSILIIVAVIGGLVIIGGLGYMAYQNWFGETKLAAKYHTSQEDCEDAGYYWYDKACHSEQGKTKESETEKKTEKKTKNCGTTDLFTSDKKPSEINFEKDSTLVCLGESATGECKEAKAVFKTKDAGDITTEIKKTDSKCLLKFSYGDKKQIPNEEKKPRANKYIQCPIESLSNQRYLALEGVENPSEQPGKYTASLYFRLNWPMKNTKKASEMDCSGPLLDYLKNKEKKTQGERSIITAVAPIGENADRGDYNTVGNAVVATVYDVPKPELKQMSDSEKEKYIINKFKPHTIALTYNEANLEVAESKLKVCKWSSQDQVWKKIGGIPQPPEDMVDIDITESSKMYVVCYPKSLTQSNETQGGEEVNYRGQSYETVEIGDQYWFAENLNVGMRVQGTATQTDNSKIEKYCYNNRSANCKTYGGLYQWGEAMQYSDKEGAQGICPDGWRIPTDEEFHALESKLTYEDNTCDKSRIGYYGCKPAAAKMAGSKFLWEEGMLSDHDDFGASGFNALPAGNHSIDGGFRLLGSRSDVWSSSKGRFDELYETETRIDRGLHYDAKGVLRQEYPPTVGFSVRCIKD